MAAKRRTLPLTAGSLTTAALLVACGAANTVLSAAAPVSAPASAPTSAPKTRMVNYHGDNYSARETPQGTILTLVGNVKIVSDDSTLLTDQATFNRTTSVADSPGKLHIDDSRNSVIGDRGVAYYKTREAKITGSVVIVVKPKQSQPAAPGAKTSMRSEFNAPATITCDNVDYFWGERVAVATGNLTLKYKDYVVTAEKAIFYGKQDRIDLTGNVHYVHSGKQESGTTPMAQAIITEGKEQLLTGAVNGELPVDNEDEKPSAAPTAPPLIDLHNGGKTPVPAGSPTTTPNEPATNPAATPAVTPATTPSTPAAPNASPTPTSAGGQP